MQLPSETPTAIGLDSLVRFDRTGNPFEVRPFRTADLPDLVHFYEGFEPKRGAQGLPPAEPDRIGRWLGRVLAQGIHLVAFREARLIGHCFVTPTPRPGIGEYAVFLHQDERGLGIGTELNRSAVEAARRRGLAGLWLTVQPQNRAAVRSYEKVGFRFRPETAFSIEPEMELRL